MAAWQETRLRSGRPALTDGPGASRIRDAEDGAMRVGRLIVTTHVLGYGSSGTIVFRGSMDGRPIAVKRTLRQVSSMRLAAGCTEHGGTSKQQEWPGSWDFSARIKLWR